LVKEKRNRYVIFEILSLERIAISKHELLEAMFSKILSLYGEFGASNIHLRLIEYDSSFQRGILRCNHKSLVMLRAALCMISELKGKSAFIRIIKVTGTLKKAREILNSLPKALFLGDEEAVPVA